MANNKINFQVGFSVDKSGLSQMQSLFQQIAFSAQEPGNKLNTELQQAAKTASTLDRILSKTFNTELGTLNVTKFNQELKNSGLTLKTIQSDFSKIGTQGADAYNRLAQAVLGTNQQLKQSSKLLNDMFTTLKNTVRYGISSSIFNNVANSIQKAYSYTKQLDTSLNDIRIVTDKSSDSMADFAQEANEAAKALGASTLDYTNASLIYYQQGLSDAEVAARAETTIKAANVTGQTGEEVSEQLTAVWNGYKVTAAETELYVDKLAAVAATTAADLEELSVGMSKVASAANAMGVDFDDLNAQIATIVSVTRQAPESVGTALKTIYARLGDLKVDGVDEFGVSLGEVSSLMVQMGIQILDQEGNLRDMSSVIAEVAEKWTGWTEAQRQAAAVAMAGKRQYNNLIALFDNWDMYTDALNTSSEAMGTLQHQQDIYMESTAAKLKTLKAAWQGLYDDAIDQDEINTGIEALTNLVEVFDNFIDSFGGGIKAIGGFGAVISSVFNKQIADSINAANQRVQVFKNNLELAKTANDIRMQGSSPDGSAAIQANTDIQVEYSKRIYEARLGLNQEQANTLINYQKEIGALEEQIVKEQQLLDKKALEANLSKEEIDQIQSYVITLDDINAKYGTITEELANGKSYLDESSHIINTQFKKGFEDSAEIETQIAQILTVIQNQSLDILDLDKADNGQLKLKVDKLQKIFDEVSLSATATDDVKTKSQEILQLVNEIQQSYKREVELQNKRSQAANIYVKTLEEQRNNQERQNNIKQQADDMLDLANNATTVTQRVTTITSALGNMAMAWSSINSLIDTWNNEQANFGDKLTQTFMTLGMTLPIVITNFSKLNEIFGITNSLSAIFSANKAKELILTQRANTVKEIENAMLVREAKLRGITVAELNADIKASIQDAVAKDAQAVATQRAATMQQRLNFAMASNPIGLVITALTALIGVIAVVSQHYEKLKAEAKEAAEEAQKSAEALQEEAEAHKSLTDEYNTAYEQYKQGTITKEDLWKTTDKLIDAYDLESSRISILSENYADFANAVKRAREEEEQELIVRNREAVQKTATSTKENAKGSVIWGNGISESNGQTRVDLLNAQSQVVIDKQLQKQAKEFFGDKYDVDSGKVIFDSNNAADLVQTVTLLQQWRIKLAEQVGEDNDRVKKLDKELDAFNKDNNFDNLIQAQDDLLQSLINSSNLDMATSQEDFNTSLEELRKNIQQEIDLGNLVDSDDINKAVAAYIGEIHSSFADQFIIDETIKNKFGEQILSLVQDSDFYKYDKDTQSAIINFGFDFSQLDSDEGKAKLKAYAEFITGNQQGIYSIPVSFQDQINDTVLKGKDIAKADWESMQSTLSPEANQILGDREEFNNKSIGERITLLQQVNELTRENNLLAIEQYEKNKQASEQIISDLEKQEELLKQKANDATARSFMGSEEDRKAAQEELRELQTQLEEISQKKYEIKVSLDMDIATDNIIQSVVGDVMTEADQMKAAAESIGKGWRVAAEDVATFAAAFPELMEGMKRLEDGSLQLDQEIVNSALETAQARIDANKQVAIEAAEDKIKQLKLELQLQEEEKRILQEALNGQKTKAETEKALRDAVSNYEQQLLDNGLIAQADALNKAQLAEKEGVDSMINILGGLNDAINIIHNNFANMLTEGPLEAFNASAGAISNISASSIDRSKIDSSFDTSDIDTMIARVGELDTQISKTKTQIASYEGFVSEMMNSVAEADKASSRVQQGLSGKEDKSKSKSSKDKDKELKKLDEEFDRYWEINKALDALDRQLKKIDKDQENLYGKELIRSLKQENELLANQTQLYEQLAAAQQQEAAELRGTLANSGVAFDASGAIINYAQATAAALKEYNDAITAYNNGLLDDAALKIHEQKFEQFKKDLERYDTLFYSEIQDTMDKIDDLRRQTLANNFKAWEVEIQLKLDFKELERDWNDFIKEVTEDFQSVFKDLRVELKSMLKDATTYTDSEGTINTIIGAVHDVAGEIDKLMGGGSSDMFESVSQAQEKLKELNDELLDAGKSLHDLWKEAWDNYLDGIDEVADAFDKLMDRFERIDDELEFQGKLIELLYGDEAYKLMSKLYEGQQKNTEVQLQSLKTQVDMWKELFYASGASLENQTSWTEDQEKYYEEWMKAQSALNNLVIDYIELLKKDYLNTVSDILAELEKSITGSSLDDLNTQWERISANADKYYDSVEGAYYIQTLANKIDQSIADADSLKAQQKLMALREKEIGYLREKENLTEYDIKAAELRYQIALKELALEDAQNNKTNMKLTRNEQGNWSYQYVADEADVASKQQDLLDAYNNLYQLASDAYENNLKALQELQEKYLESAKKIAEDTTLTEEEKQQKLLELREWYLEQYQLLAEENQLYRNDLATSGAALLLEIYKQDQDAYEAMTEKERELVDALINANLEDYMELEEALKENYQEIGDKAKEVMSEIRLDWTSGAQLIADLWNKDSGWSVKTQVNQAYDSIIEANRKYKEAVDWCAAAVERNFGEEGITGAIQNAEYETDNLKYKTIEMVNDSVPYLQELRSYVDQIGNAWKSVQQEIMNTINLIDAYLRKVGEANAAAAQSASIGSSGGGSSSGGSGGSGNRSSKGSGGSAKHSWAVYNPAMGSNAALAHLSTKSEAEEWVKRNGGSYYQEYNTGGYTGSWGDSSGRIAMLHQKELVLNADDTKNFLSGINTIRDLSSSVGGSIQDAVLKAVANTALSLGSIKTTGFSGGISNNNNTTDNVFNITAEFPNANSVDDIREAILSLPNIASQYSNSTLK